MQSKSYKKMDRRELLDEIDRVQELLRRNKNIFTQKQNRKYLEKLYDRFAEVVSNGI
jgi:hypothetical protein